MSTPMTQNTSPPRREFSTAQLKLIRRTVARQCSDAEFDEFIVVAMQTGLDPLRRQISPLIIAEHNPERRRMAPWATIDGLRVIAARHGDYRPMETPPIIEYESSHADPNKNPLGIVRAEVRAWKLSQGRWHPVAGEAWWEEHAPMRQFPAGEQAGGVEGPEPTLDPAWRRMGRIMISKCAEAQALRRGWPDVLSGLYAEEELHAVRNADLTASEILHQREADSLRRAISKRTLWFVFTPGGPFEPVTLEEVVQRLTEFSQSTETPDQLSRFEMTNRMSLQTLWEWAPTDAFALKQVFEARRDSLVARECDGELSMSQAATQCGGAVPLREVTNSDVTDAPPGSSS